MPRCAQRRNEFRLPHALTAIATVLFEYPRTRRLKPLGKLLVEFPDGAIEMGIRAPAQVLGPIKDFLDAHFEDHVGMSADPHTF